MIPGQPDPDPGPAETIDRLAVESLGVVVVADQGATTSLDA
jgi:hypothetical protein